LTKVGVKDKGLCKVEQNSTTYIKHVSFLDRDATIPVAENKVQVSFRQIFAFQNDMQNCGCSRQAAVHSGPFPLHAYRWTAPLTALSTTAAAADILLHVTHKRRSEVFLQRSDN
jgi:hypothetical protein